MNSRTVLFVCTGNSCRSPMAEYLFQARLPAASAWTAGSAGLHAVPGGPASAGAVEALRELGIDASGHRSRPLSRDLVNGAGMIVAMTQAHEAEIASRFPAVVGQIRRLTSFGVRGPGGDIFDPVGLPLEGYRRCRDAIAHAVADLVLYLVETSPSPGGRPDDAV